MKTTLVTAYTNPDLDGLACVYGYAEYLIKTGRQVIAGIIGKPHVEAEYILERFKIPKPQSILNSDGYDQIILVDVSNLDGLNGSIEPDKVIEIIDHRKVNEVHKFLNAKLQIEFVGAAATLIAEKYIQDNIEISKESAILIYSAIISNTLNFKGTVTTDRDRRAAEWVNQTAQLSESFWKELFLAKSDLSGLKLKQRIHFAGFVMGNKKVSIAQIEMIGARKLVKERGLEIIQIINDLAGKVNSDLIFLNIIELEEEKNYFVVTNDITKKVLEKVLNINFVGNIGEKSGLILRKQIVPLLKDELEQNNQI
jgi:inorganic pyrophosphatase/exopolyphosphatase